MATKTDAKSQVLSYWYDTLGRLTQVKNGTTVLRNLTYDANGGYGTSLAGRLARVDYGSGNAWTELCAYDPAGGMVSKQLVWRRTGPTYTYTFDSMARPLSLSDDGSGDVSLGTQSFYAQGPALPIYGLGLSGGTVLNNPYSTRAVTMNNTDRPGLVALRILSHEL